jgi:hypothetical protein
MRDFHIYKGKRGSGSSLFMQNYEYLQQNWDILKSRVPRELAETLLDRSELVRIEKLALHPLDEVIREVALNNFIPLPEDGAQGAEYEILRGESNYLPVHASAFIWSFLFFP